MQKLIPILIVLLVCLQSCNDTHQHELLASNVDSDISLFASIESNRQWPSYRGYFASGYLDDANLPDSFNVETSYNIIWEVDIPGLGLSCPAIWDDRIFITTAVSEMDKEGYRTGLYGDIAPVDDSSEHVWKVYCIDKSTGEIRWEQDACRGVPHVKRHPKSSHANTTVATDGKHVVVFLGSEGLYCYGVEGDLLWKRDFGLINSAWNVVESAEWEFCSSPVIFQDKVIIQADALNTAFVAVLDLFTGETIWRKERDEITGWCTPNIYFDDNKPLMAVKNSITGEIPYPETDSLPGDGIAWFYDRGGAYMTSVLVYDSLLYRLRWNGNLACFDARSGEEIYSQTVDPSSFIACPVAADGRIYMVSEEGDVFIAQAGREYHLLQQIPLGEVSLVTPGITEGMIVFRTAGKLIAVSAT